MGITIIKHYRIIEGKEDELESKRRCPLDRDVR